jgi:hypothetical protein
VPRPSSVSLRHAIHQLRDKLLWFHVGVQSNGGHKAIEKEEKYVLRITKTRNSLLKEQVWEVFF